MGRSWCSFPRKRKSAPTLEEWRKWEVRNGSFRLISVEEHPPNTMITEKCVLQSFCQILFVALLLVEEGQKWS
ncbi:hypothetical protein BJ508DRAFT_19958 [Ascobolus immersus RN42]|uniref:Uncharacterized protein n=1 Tax=Ascobolus immersus RN42 TaxID=1160509 RepID=A0A3N4IJM4_ASCIM|nr:hypothetical protein BJ508DRAFT_19958 [Ascobolus immersus RN42]